MPKSLWHIILTLCQTPGKWITPVITNGTYPRVLQLPYYHPTWSAYGRNFLSRILFLDFTPAKSIPSSHLASFFFYMGMRIEKNKAVKVTTSSVCPKCNQCFWRPYWLVPCVLSARHRLPFGIPGLITGKVYSLLFCWMPFF